MFRVFEIRGTNRFLNIVILASLWVLWLERNNHIFDGVEGVSDVWDCIIQCVALWTSQDKEFRAFSS